MNYSNNNEKNKIFGLLPSNTNLILAHSYADPYSIINRENLNELNKKLNFDMSLLVDLFGSEIALVSNAINKKSISSDTWFLLQFKNPGRASNYLKQIAQNTGSNYSEEVNGHLIRKIKYNNLIPSLFGNAYSAIEHSWYVFLEDFVVFGNSEASLKKLLRHYDSGKTLDLNENFRQFSDNLSDSYSVLLMLKPSEQLEPC